MNEEVKQNENQEEAQKDEQKEEKNEEKKEEASDNDSQENQEAEEVEVPEQFKDIVERIENMTVLELNELVKVLEKKFGVSAVAVAATAGAQTGGEQEKDEFDVVLTAVGDQKIAVIKVVKEVLGLGLKEAKEFVESAPKPVKEGVKKEEAEELKKKFEEAGATVELK